MIVVAVRLTFFNDSPTRWVTVRGRLHPAVFSSTEDGLLAPAFYAVGTIDIVREHA